MSKYASKSRSYSPRQSNTKAERREARRASKRRGESNVFDLVNQEAQMAAPRRNESKDTGPIEYRRPRQKIYHDAIKSHSLTVGLGPAGTGKTHIAATHAAMQLLDKKIKRIIVSRPAVESGRGMGFLPGTVEEKWAPYFRPVRRILEKRLGVSYVDAAIKAGSIEIAPIEYIRGNTFEDAFVILDEAQNCTPEQMKTFLTRLGRNSTVVITGDDEQVDIKGKSGLPDALERLSGVHGIAHFEFGIDDIVRHGLVREIILRYRR